VDVIAGARFIEVTGWQSFIHLRHCVTPPPAEDMCPAARIEELCKGLGVCWVENIFPGTVAPVFYQPVGHCGDRQVATVIGAKVPGTGISLRIFPQGSAKQQVTAEGFQDVLPGPDGTGAAVSLSGMAV
jgi:hypothetical protein